MKNNNYLLDIGEQTKSCLRLLDKIYGVFSRDLLQRARLITGNTVLEVGCGTGNMTCWLAKQVGDTGHVYTVDKSGERIKLAQQLAEDNGLTNISFIPGSVFDLSELPLVDFVYSRFTLMYLSKPHEALTLLPNLLKHRGLLVCEEASYSAMVCYPFSPVYDKWRQLLLDLAYFNGLDANFGEKIYSCFRSLELKNIFATFAQPIYQTSYEKQFITLLFEEVKTYYIRSQLMEKQEAVEFVQQLNHFIHDDNYLVSFPRITQIYGQKL